MCVFISFTSSVFKIHTDVTRHNQTMYPLLYTSLNNHVQGDFHSKFKKNTYSSVRHCYKVLKLWHCGIYRQLNTILQSSNYILKSSKKNNNGLTGKSEIVLVLAGIIKVENQCYAAVLFKLNTDTFVKPIYYIICMLSS